MSNLAVYDISVGHYDYQGIWREGRANSAGGVSVKYGYCNQSQKTIKYLHLTFKFYNRVNDVVKSVIGNYSSLTADSTGPIEPNISKKGYCENGIYNSTAARAELVKAKIEYMDGTEEVLNGSEIDNVKPTPSGGCYVATAVYGSYDCPEVWVLRRYRDNDLSSTWHGRLFIHIYYAISPTLVKWFGNTGWFNNLFKPKLDRFVLKLKKEGVEDTPYTDKKW